MRMYKGHWGKPCRYTQCIKTHILHYKSHEILYQVLQVTQNQYPSQYLHTTWESVSGTTVTWIPSEHAMRFEVHYHHYSIKLYSLLLHFLVLGGSYTQLWKAVVDRCINSESFSHGLCIPVSPVFMESAGATLEEFTHWSELTAHSNFCSFHVKPCLTWKLWLLQQTVYINITDEFKPSEAYLLVPSSTSTL